MMITIHGFPAKTKYQDVKILIKQECNINDFILDNLINDTDGTKKVRIGLTDNTEGYKVMKCLDGYRMPGNFVLKAMPVGKTADKAILITSAEASPTVATYKQSSLQQPSQQSTFDSRPSYQNQTRNDYSSAPRNDYISQSSNDYNNQGSHGPIHGASGPHGSVGSHGARPSHVSGGPQSSIDMARPSPWASGGNESSQWNTPMATQIPQNTFGFTSPQANINPSYGQQHPPHQSHPRTEIRPGFNQGRATDQSYGYTPKSNVPEVVPANSRYRWVRKTEPEPVVPKSPHSDDDCASLASAHDNLNEKLEDLLDNLEKHNPDEPSNQLGPSKTTVSNKAKKREKAKRRNINNLSSAQRRRLYFWLKRGKTFMEARELCELRVKQVPEYPAAKAEKKRKKREITLRKMSPERRERAIKLDRLQGRSLPGMPIPERIPGQVPIRVRIVDELERMSVEKIEKLQDKILELLDAETEGNGPKFVGCTSRAGYLTLSCADPQTVEWLEKHVQGLELWEGAHFKVIDVSLIPKPVIGIAFVADPDLDDEAILRMLKSQNEEINFSDWWVTSKKPEIPTGQTVTFSIDQVSLEQLAQANYFVYLGLKKTKIRIRSKKPTGELGVPPIGQMGKVKGTIGMPRKGQVVKAKKGEMGKPHMKGIRKKQTGMAPMRQMDIAPMDKMGMAPGMGQMGMMPMEQMGMAPMGPMGMMNMGPMGPMGMRPMGPMGMGPMGPMAMPPMGPMSMGPMGPMGMPPMGPMGMGPMGPMGMPPMGPMGMRPIRPMGMVPMNKMRFIPAASTSDYPGDSTYTSSFSQPKQFSGRNQPKHFSNRNQQKHFDGRNQAKQLGGENQPKKFGGGDQGKKFGGGNQGKKFGGGNQGNKFGGGNQSKHSTGGKQPKNVGGGNQPKNYFGGNKPKQSGGGKNAKHNKKQVEAASNGGTPKCGNSKKKLSPSKARNKARRMGNRRNGNPGQFQKEKNEPNTDPPKVENSLD